MRTFHSGNEEQALKRGRVCNGNITGLKRKWRWRETRKQGGKKKCNKRLAFTEHLL